jgi:hypothetical protein
MTTSYMLETLAQDTDGFEKVLADMETYYIATVQQEESVAPLPRYISAYLVELEGPQAPASEFELQFKKENVGELTSWSTSTETSVTEVTTKKLDNKISDDQWNSDLDKMQAADIEYASNLIKSGYQKIKEQGNAHPEQRSALIKLAQVLSEGITKTIDTVVTFLTNLADKIYAWLKKAYEFIKTTFILVANTIETYFC